MNTYHQIAEQVSKRYQSVPYLLGIIWIGSAAYGIVDEFSDIDLHLIVKKGMSDFVMEQFEVDGIKIEVDMMDIDWLLQENTPDSEQNWIRERAKILFDPHHNLQTLFKKISHFTNKEKSDLLWQLYKELFNSYDFEKSVNRGETIAASLYIFKTIEVLSKFLFIYNDLSVPTYKWRWYFIRKQKLFNESIIKQLLTITPQNLEPNFKLLEKIENLAKEMMLKKGFETEKVMEPWRF